MTYSKRALQLAVAAGGFVPVGAGLAGMLKGPGMVDPRGGASIHVDSHYRYLSGLLLGVGLGFWTTIPNIEREVRRFRLLAAIVMLGGIGRLYSLLIVGMPDPSMLFGLIMELGVTPLLAFWQYRLGSGLIDLGRRRALQRCRSRRRRHGHIDRSGSRCAANP
ncbi:MAG: DUF4345 domain-containing protein [Methylocella sp.]